MPSLITLHPDPNPTLAQLHPHNFDQLCLNQYRIMPGLRWKKVNGVGYYVGDTALVRATAKLLEDADLAVCDDQSTGGHGWDDKIFWVMPPFAVERLYAYQREGLRRCCNILDAAGGCLLADDMGLGKTPQGIAVADTLSMHAPVIVVAPAVVVPKWRREIALWSDAPDRFNVYSYEGFLKATKIQSGKVKPDKKLAPLPNAPGAIILDEAHYCSNGRALRTKAVKGFCTSHPTMLRLGLTGTPLTTRPRDLYSILDILFPSRFGSFFQFTRRYAGGTYVEIPGLETPVWQADGCTNPLELAERLKLVMVRRTKSQVALELPPRTRTIVPVTLPLKAQKHLQKVQEALDLQSLDLGSKLGSAVGSMLSGVEEYKIEAALALASELIANGHKPLLVCTRIATGEKLAKELNAPFVCGETSTDEREQLLQNSSVGVATIGSIGVGINLVNYDCMIFVGLDYVPSKLRQAEDRIHRIGSTHAFVEFFYLIGTGSIDEIIQSRVIERLSNEDKILGASDSGLGADLAGGSDDELLAALIASL